MEPHIMWSTWPLNEAWQDYRKRVEAVACGDKLDRPKHEVVGTLVRNATYYMDPRRSPDEKISRKQRAEMRKAALEDLIQAGLWLHQCPDWGNKQVALFAHSVLVNSALDFVNAGGPRNYHAQYLHAQADMVTLACHAN